MRTRLSKEGFILGIAGGITYSIVVLSAWVLHPEGWGSFESVLRGIPLSIGTVYAVSGLVLTGGVLAILFEKYGLVSPIATIAVTLSVVWYYQYTIGTVLPPSPFLVFVLGWPVILGVALAVGGAEKIFVRPYA